MGKPSPPAPPDPKVVAQAQTASNIGTAVANSYIGNADTYGPLGSTTYKKSGVERITVDGQGYNVPTWEVNQRLSPDQQHLLNLQEAAGINLGQTAVRQSEKIGALLNTTINPNQLPASVRNAANAPTLQTAQNLTPQLQTQIGANDFSADRQRVEDAMYTRLNPQIDRDRDSLQTRLANQGVTSGSEAYNRAIDELNRSISDQRSSIVLAGGQEQSRLFGMDQAQGQFHNQALQQGVQNNLAAAEHANQVAGNQFGYQNTEDQNQQTLRQQALQEQISLRNQPIAEISALMNGGQPTMPQFQQFQPGHVSDVPVGQYMYQTAQMNNQNYATQVGASNAAMGGMSGLGSSFLSAMPFLFSDRRLKENVKKIGKADNKLPIFSYNYKGDPVPRIGFMAQDVEKVHPEAVATHPSGFKMVNYAEAVQPVEN